MNWFRPHIKNLTAYSSARTEFKGDAKIFLDANENPFKNAFNRYPDPQQTNLKRSLAQRKGLTIEQVFIGNGSDEAIDLLIRATCEPGQSSIALCSPTYGMYAISASIHNIGIVNVPLNDEFQLNTSVLIKKAQHCSLVFLCSPNNPSGNLLRTKDIVEVLENCSGLVVVDEAYIDFANVPSWTHCLDSYSNLVVLQTFSKALGLAGLRIGMAFAHQEVVQVLNTIKPPYNLNTYSQQIALERLQNEAKTLNEVRQIISERLRVTQALQELKTILDVFPSDANFLLFRVQNSEALYQYLLQKGLVLRNRSQAVPNALRVGLGTPSENDYFLNQIEQYEKDPFYR